MEEKEKFYTLTGYRKKGQSLLTEAMEDYLEMVYRKACFDEEIRIKDLACELHVKASSVSKMMEKLKALDYIHFEPYGIIYLTKKGETLGHYLLWRHNILTDFLKKVNKQDFCLEQVEKIEHFVDFPTLSNLEKIIKKL